MTVSRRVATRAELVGAAGNPDCGEILVSGDVDDLPTLQLAPGQVLRGVGKPMLRFQTGSDGVRLSADNAVADLGIATDANRQAISNDTSIASFGQLALCRLVVTGCVRLIAEAQALGGHLQAADIHIAAADAPGFDERPSGFGVEVVPAAFTLWNRHVDPACLVTAALVGIGAGRAGRPVRGGGIFVAGTLGGGRTAITRLETDEVHSDGGIAPGTADRISGGVFVVSGASVGLGRNRAPVTTYGANDISDGRGSVEGRCFRRPPALARRARLQSDRGPESDD